MTEKMTAYSRHLEGVKINDSLKVLFRDALEAAKEHRRFNSGSNDKERGPPYSDRPRKHQLVPPLSKEEASSALLEFQESTPSQSTNVIPIRILRSIASLLGDTVVERALEGQNLAGGGTAVTLAFTSPPPPDDSLEHQRFLKRMERLRFKQEEVKYSKLTSNLGRVATDDVTTRSMTYAASIGLNMIVAPLSFGGLMYFFGGALLDYFWPSSKRANDFAPDIRKVIVGVLSGVVMLFIEMLLFVIRTHEMDRAIRRKSRKKKQGPFGHYTSQTSKTFKED